MLQYAGDLPYLNVQKEQQYTGHPVRSQHNGHNVLHNLQNHVVYNKSCLESFQELGESQDTQQLH